MRWSGRHAEGVRPMDHQLSAGDLPRAQFLAERAFTTVLRFLHVEAVSGVVLLIAAAAALIWANSPLAYSNHALWHPRAARLAGGGEPRKMFGHVGNGFRFAGSSTGCLQIARRVRT